MEFKLPFEIKKRILSEILKLDNPFNLSDNYTLPDFISEFISLKDMPSEDSRFPDAYQDTFQHTVNNDDWEFDYIFGERFGIYDDDSLYRLFLEKTINLASESNKTLIIPSLKTLLQKYKFRIVQKYDVTSEIVFVIEEYEDSFNHVDIPQNNIPFYVVPWRSHPKALYPFFRLTSDSWNDFGYWTYFTLSYCVSDVEITEIGGVRILKRGEITTVLPDDFLNLTSEYCSLFALEASYFTLKQLFPERFTSILSALNDAGYFPTICEKFESDPAFIKSLCRDSNESEKILRTVRSKLNYGDISNFFDFEFLFKPIYSDVGVNLNFDFDVNKTIPKRLYVVIGKNGVGKTLLLKDLITKLSTKDSDTILPKVPLFGKTIVVSYSYFDNFDDVENRIDFNFLFCGVINPKTNKPLTNDELIIRVIEAVKTIEKKEIENKYFCICREFLHDEVLEGLFSWKNYIEKENYDCEDFNFIKIRTNNISNIINTMSSGQKALLFIVTEIVANIRYNSLIIFDEPETHLHPNAITEFMSVIIDLLEEFDSYGIIATHSPLIVREVFADNIYVFEKDKEIPRVRKLEFETFGENLSTITSEIFGNRDVPKYYIKTLKELVNEGLSYEEIENRIKGEVPLNLNLKILLKSLVKNRDEKPK